MLYLWSLYNHLLRFYESANCIIGSWIKKSRVIGRGLRSSDVSRQCDCTGHKRAFNIGIMFYSNYTKKKLLFIYIRCCRLKRQLLNISKPPQIECVRMRGFFHILHRCILHRHCHIAIRPLLVGSVLGPVPVSRLTNTRIDLLPTCSAS